MLSPKAKAALPDRCGEPGRRLGHVFPGGERRVVGKQRRTWSLMAQREPEVGAAVCQRQGAVIDVTSLASEREASDEYWVA